MPTLASFGVQPVEEGKPQLLPTKVQEGPRGAAHLGGTQAILVE